MQAWAGGRLSYSFPGAICLHFWQFHLLMAGSLLFPRNHSNQLLYYLVCSGSCIHVRICIFILSEFYLKKGVIHKDIIITEYLYKSISDLSFILNKVI